MAHQLSSTDIKTRDIGLELKKYFNKKQSNGTWEEFLIKKVELWIDNTLHVSGREDEKRCILLEIKKAPESSDGDLACHAFSLEDAVAYLTTGDPSVIITIKNRYVPIHASSTAEEISSKIFKVGTAMLSHSNTPPQMQNRYF